MTNELAISDSLLGLGIELLAGAGLVLAISFCLSNKAETVNKKTDWLSREPILIFSCLGIGVVLSIAPSIPTTYDWFGSTWVRSLVQSAGIELLGGGVLITLFENLERKFKNSAT